MAKNKMIQTTRQVIPTIYAYTTPGYAPHEGWTKIGDTVRGAKKRVEEQLATADINYKLEWEMNATYEASNETFRDYDFHAYLQKQGVERKKRKNRNGHMVNTEWFHILPVDAKQQLYEFRSDRGVLKALGAVPYTLRDEQLDAVQKTKDYFLMHEDSHPEYLWNCKPRFGKTLTAYDLCAALGAKRILIVTNRPAIANSWYSDYAKFFGPESGYYFVSSTDSLKGKAGVMAREELAKLVQKGSPEFKANYKGCIEFVSLQDLKGSKYFGGRYDKLKHLYKGDVFGNDKGLTWDVLIIDEAHEGVDTYKTDTAFNNIARKYTLHLSGTPFKALADDKFESNAIYNWTYADEQKAKAEWDDDDRSNPYETLPKLNLLTYRMSDIVLDKLKKGADFDGDGDNEAYAFDLNEMFGTNESGKFVHDKDIDLFLDTLTTGEKFPFSDEYRGELKHTLWILKYVASAKELAKKLKNHPVFGQYDIVLAAGDGKIQDNVRDETVEYDEDEMDAVVGKSYDRVIDAIAHYRERGKAGTITLSVGQLTTGITIPEWTAVMMLSNIKSPALYMQSAFRAQNPCLFNYDGKTFRKENAYVFDFDPARTLEIFEKFANGLHADTANDKGDSDTRKQHVRELLNYFPVYGEADDGEMIELDAEKVLSIPRAIHAKEVVRKGFMCNFLFQNISGIFAAPAVVRDILNTFEPIKDPVTVNRNTKADLDINEDGEIDIPQSTVIGSVQDTFGDKLYEEIDQELEEAIERAREKAKDSPDPEKEELREIMEAFHVKVSDKLTEIARDKHGRDMKKSTQKSVAREINRSSDKELERLYGDYRIHKTLIEDERQKKIEEAKAEGREEDIPSIEAEAAAKLADNRSSLNRKIDDTGRKVIDYAGETIVKAIETDKRQREKDAIEDRVRDHLRGFTRTIPSFLMAYGDENTTLAGFDKIVPDEVFQEVTRNMTTHQCITLDQFRFLRDGGDYTDAETGEVKHFNGHLFDEVVFNDSVREFMRKRDELADYFSEDATEDIFDYVPPQRTNQIYTPRKVVKQMLAYLEQENPGCFDDPDATFIDPYMKSGMYITEIVKRLYNSPTFREIFPDKEDRLDWIFKTNVYGLAPTEIIYRIATNYIFGFQKVHGMHIQTDHFRLFDSLPAAQDGNLKEKLDELYG